MPRHGPDAPVPVSPLGEADDAVSQPSRSAAAPWPTALPTLLTDDGKAARHDGMSASTGRRRVDAGKLPAAAPVSPWKGWLFHDGRYLGIYKSIPRLYNPSVRSDNPSIWMVSAM